MTGSNQAALLEDGQNRRSSFLADVGGLLALAIPMFLAMVSWVIMKATDSSLVGHAGTKYLEAVSVSDLWTSSTGVFIQSRAAGTLCAQALGAGNKKLVGIWIQVAYVVMFVACAFVAFAWCMTGPILRAFGQPEEVVSNASYFAIVLMLCLPLRVCFSQLSIFFSAQKIMKPTMYCSVIGMLTNLALGLLFVSGFPISNFYVGFKACPWVTTTVEYLQFFLFWFGACYIYRLHEECWPGFKWKHITGARVKEYLKQYVPTSLSLASDFWRVSAIGAIATSLSEEDIAVWNTGYRICWIVLTFVGSLGGAMSITLGQAMGRGDVKDALRQTMAGGAVCIMVLTVLCTVVVLQPRRAGSIFSSDPLILDLFEESRWGLAGFVFFMNLSVLLEKIPICVGRPNIALWLGAVGSWVGQVPGAYICTTYWRKDLVGLYVGSTFGYLLLNALFLVVISRFDWEKLAGEARARSEVTRQVSNGSEAGQHEERS